MFASAPGNPEPLSKVCCGALLLAAYGISARADVPLHERIEAAIGVGTASYDESAADDAGHAAFVLRIRLLDSPQYARRMQYVFDTMLMERRPEKYIKAEQWRNYLRGSFAENKPWDQLVTEMLTADGADEATRPAARFLLDRELKTDVMTRDLGRMLLGRDLQCAQCHDHPKSQAIFNATTTGCRLS